MQIGKEEFKLPLFADGMMLYLKRPRKLHQRTPKHYKHLQQSSRVKNQLSVTFPYTKSEPTEKEYRKNFPLTISSKNTWK
jgi:hypothetical protein